MKKISLKNVKGMLSRKEMKSIIGAGGYNCYCNGYSLGLFRTEQICIENCLWAKC